MELEFKELSKHYGNKIALTNFSVKMRCGIYGIIGPNGAGKSTLMNLLTDNISRTSGGILYNGTDILSLGSSFRELIGYMPQQQGLYDNFSAKRFLLYMAGLKGIKKSKAKEEITFLLNLVGLTNEAHRKLSGFSGGMRQRVMLAATLLGNPQIIILDEPTAGLDPEERIRIRNFIFKIAMDRIVILATHVVSDIECIAGKVLLLKNGKLLDMKTPAELIASIEGKVYEKICNQKEQEELSKCYKIGNINQRKDGVYVRVIGDIKPEGFEEVSSNIDLEDVYLYYLEK